MGVPQIIDIAADESGWKLLRRTLRNEIEIVTPNTQESFITDNARYAARFVTGSALPIYRRDRKLWVSGSALPDLEAGEWEHYSGVLYPNINGVRLLVRAFRSGEPARQVLALYMALYRARDQVPRTFELLDVQNVTPAGIWAPRFALSPDNQWVCSAARLGGSIAMEVYSAPDQKIGRVHRAFRWNAPTRPLAAGSSFYFFGDPSVTWDGERFLAFAALWRRFRKAGAFDYSWQLRKFYRLEDNHTGKQVPAKRAPGMGPKLPNKLFQTTPAELQWIPECCYSAAIKEAYYGYSRAFATKKPDQPAESWIRRSKTPGGAKRTQGYAPKLAASLTRLYVATTDGLFDYRVQQKG